MNLEIAIYVYIFIFASLIIIAERFWPAFKLPSTIHWYKRISILVTLTMIFSKFATFIWNYFTLGIWIIGPLTKLAAWQQGLVCFVIGSLFFYFWHYLRHKNWTLWRLLHQMHHSPKRIEALTAYYVHPFEGFVSAILNTSILYFLGGSSDGLLYSIAFFSSAGIFYHSNLKTPAILDYFIATPELHRIHHIRGKQWGNFSDLPIWDRLFGTFIPRSIPEKNIKKGFRDNLELHFWDILKCVNVLSKYPALKEKK